MPPNLLNVPNEFRRALGVHDLSTLWVLLHPLLSRALIIHLLSVLDPPWGLPSVLVVCVVEL